ncbi:hypothetical protein HAX54_044132 [Datura stramonium]|uniref:Uncharacterized protein n=1 Tax=Datura stramonium TaxID=4076 RepID=A0ABS8W2D8_DATST|nr:hypothetical protein [Datura stramonium]
MSFQFFRTRSLILESIVLIPLPTRGMLFMISAYDSIAMYLAIEPQSLCFYVLIAASKESLNFLRKPAPEIFDLRSRDPVPNYRLLPDLRYRSRARTGVSGHPPPFPRSPSLGISNPVEWLWFRDSSLESPGETFGSRTGNLSPQQALQFDPVRHALDIATGIVEAPMKTALLHWEDASALVRQMVDLAIKLGHSILECSLARAAADSTPCYRHFVTFYCDLLPLLSGATGYRPKNARPGARGRDAAIDGPVLPLDLRIMEDVIEICTWN